MNRRYAICLGLLAASCSAAAFVACGNDSGGGGGGTDGGADHAVTPDATGGDSSTKDSTTTDTGSGEGGSPEGSTAEGGEGGEGGGGDAGDGGGSDGGDASDGGGACQLFDASGLDDASVQAGFVQVWQVYKCWKCHQNPTDLVDDAGNGILLNGNDAGNLGATIFPPNLTTSVEGLGCWTNDQIQTAILTGKDPEGGALCPPMPVFGADASTPGRPMDAGTAKEIIDYIRSLTPSHKIVPDTTCGTSADAGDAGDAGGGDAGGDGPTDAGGQ